MMFQELQGLMDWFFPKPLSIIFLDIDGVLIDYNKSIFIYRLLERCNHIYEQQKKLSKIITDPESKFLTSHYFSDKAVANLENMIIKISRTARVAIVISSGWRTWGTVDDLRNHMFAQCAFPHLIIDKTPFPTDMINGEPLSSQAQRKYGFDLSDRGQEIDYWLRENQQKLGVQNFVILDDSDNGIAKRFPHNFVHIKDLFSESDALKACQIMTRRVIACHASAPAPFIRASI